MSLRLLNDKSPKSKQPGLIIPLKDHQLTMLSECLTIENYAKQLPEAPIGILADEAGTGKTAVLLSIILSEKRIFGGTQNLIIVPQNIVKQWSDEIKKFINESELSIGYFIDYATIQQVYKDRKIFSYYDIILTTSGYANVIFSSIQSLDIKIHRIIIDEVDTNKGLFREINIKCDMCWLVSASIDNIKNDFTLFDYTVNLNDLRNMTCKCESEYIQKSLGLPIPNNNKIICNGIIDSVYQYMTPEIVKKINALNFSSISNEYSNKTATDSVSAITLHNKELLYTLNKNYNYLISSNDELKRAYDYQSRYFKEEEIKKFTINIEQCSERLNNIANIITNKYKLCYLCLKENDLHIYDDCKYILCGECLEETIDVLGKCGCCLSEINADNIVSIEDNQNNAINHKTKLDYLSEITKSITSKTKMIIFSNYVNTFRYIEPMLHKQNIKPHYFTSGNIQDIIKDIDKYKNDINTQVVFLNSEFNIFGLNLEFTTDIIILHQLKNSLKHQVIGRAQRFGRTESLNIYEILNENEK